MRCSRRRGRGVRAGLFLGVLVGLAGCSEGPLTPSPSAKGRVAAFQVQPDDAAVGHALPDSVVVRLREADGTFVTGPGAVKLGLGPAGSGAALAGPTAASLDNGAATFHGLSVDRPGTYTLVAESGDARTESLPFLVVPRPDIIRIRNTSGRARGVLVDGFTSRGFIDDRAILGTDSILPVVFRRSEVHREVVVFDRGRAVTSVTDFAWTEGVDTVEVVLRDVVRVPATAWAVGVDPGRVEATLEGLEAAWDEEGVGVRLDVEEIVDRRELALPESEGRELCEPASDARTRVGYRPGHINIYYTDFEGTGGLACRDAVLIAPQLAIPSLLAHEIGHLFGLDHYFELDVDGFSGTGNALGGGGTYYTEGQIFYAHYSEDSILVWLFDGVGNPRDCSGPRPPRLERPWCVPHNFRFWPDGAGFMAGG